MKICQQLTSGFKDQRGVAAIIVAIVLPVLIGFAALAIDIGYLCATRNELQDAADAAALAGTGDLGDQYANNIDPINTLDIKTIAKNTALENQGGGKSIHIKDDDIEIGCWNGDDHTLNSCTAPDTPDAVRVTARRDSSVITGPITTFFGRIFGIDSLPVRAVATAALTGPSVVKEGVIKLPIGISKGWLDPDGFYCDQNIVFHDKNKADVEGCAGWHIFTEDLINANDLFKLLFGMILADDDPENPYDGSVWLNKNYPGLIVSKGINPYASPETTAGETIYEFIGGDVASLFNNSALQALFDYYKAWKPWVDEDGDNTEDDVGYDIADADTWTDVIINETGDPGSDGIEDNKTSPYDEPAYVGTEGKYVWKTTVPVYDAPCGDNPTGDILIIGFSDVYVMGLIGPPDKVVVAKVICDNYKITRGGGATSGTKGTIPNLVE